MCGIVGFVGNSPAAPILLEGLSRLEYRGYDSAGIAVGGNNTDEAIAIAKAKGKLQNLFDKTHDGHDLPGTWGIGHTRWATHGEPSETNAHPHHSAHHKIIGVHNGIIENYQEMRHMLLHEGYTFYSQTDTEVVINLIEFYYNRLHNPLAALQEVVHQIRGSYALELMFTDYPEVIYAARKDSPMIIGTAHGESYIASDVPAILKYTRSVYYIGDCEIACVHRGSVEFFNADGQPLDKEAVQIAWDIQGAEKEGYPHFMLKEIHEQPRAVLHTINSVLVRDEQDEANEAIDIRPDAFGFSIEELQAVKQIYIVACGSSYHVGVASQYVIENLAQIPVRVELASEFRYRKLLLQSTDLVVVISQSGETADTLAALRAARNKGVKTLAIVNVVGSSIAREAEKVFYTLAGPEIAVATTKAYSAQLIACYLLALQMAKVKATLSEAEVQHFLQEVEQIPAKIKTIWDNEKQIQQFAQQFKDKEDIFFIGRGIDYAIALEGSLKMKEISYIHSEAYAAGELKHGTISLIEKDSMVIGVLTQPGVYEKTMSNMLECQSRGGYLVGVSELQQNMEGLQFCMEIPEIEPCFAASLAIVPLQLLSYYASVVRGLDVDKPRNLAKSVTVE